MDARRRITGQVPMLLRRSFVQQGGEPGRPAAPRDGAARQIPAGLLFRGGTQKPPLMLSGGQTVKGPRRVCACGRKESPIIFFGDMCGEENTSRPANVRAVCLGRTARALQSGRKLLCQKVLLFDSLHGAGRDLRPAPYVFASLRAVPCGRLHRRPGG